MIFGCATTLMAKDVLEEDANDVREPCQIGCGSRIFERPVAYVTAGGIERADAVLPSSEAQAYAAARS